MVTSIDIVNANQIGLGKKNDNVSESSTDIDVVNDIDIGTDIDIDIDVDVDVDVDVESDTNLINKNTALLCHIYNVTGLRCMCGNFCNMIIANKLLAYTTFLLVLTIPDIIFVISGAFYYSAGYSDTIPFVDFVFITSMILAIPICMLWIPLLYMYLNSQFLLHRNQHKLLQRR